MRANLKQATDTASATSAGPNVAAIVGLSGPMHFTAPRKELQAAIKRLASVVDKRSTMPMLANVCIRVTPTEITLCATDLNVSAVVVAKSWDTFGGGQATVNAKALGDILKKLPDGPVTVRANDRGVDLTSGSARVSLEGLHARDYPKLPPIFPGDPMLALTGVDAAMFGAMLDAVSHAMCKDETRFHLNGVHFEYDGTRARCVATDGHRLVKSERDMPREGDFSHKGMIIPAKAVAEIRKLLGKGTCQIGMVKHSGVEHFAVRFGGTTIVVKPIDAQFPPYDQVIPKDNRRLVTVDRKALIGALERAALVCSGTRGVKLETADGALTLASDNPDTGEVRETLPAELNPDQGDFAVGCNPRYALDALDALDCERVTLAFDSATVIEGKKYDPRLSPFMIRGTDDTATRAVRDAEFLAVIMPMRI